MYGQKFLTDIWISQIIAKS